MLETGLAPAITADPALEELHQAYRAGNLVLFAGAGVSIAAGLPPRKRLVELLAKRAQARDAPEANLAEIAALAGKHQLIDALSALKECLGPTDFGAAVERLLDGQAIDDLPALVLAIGALRPGLRAVLTTNLDDLLERAFEGAWPALTRATADLAQRRRFILKLHGTLVDRSTWVLTRDELDRALHTDDKRKQAFGALFNACSLLFVGYDLADEDFEQVLTQVRAFAGEQPPRHFALIEAAAATPFRRAQLEKAGVRLLAYPNPDGRHRGAIQLLEGLADVSVASPSARIAAASGEPACPFPGLEFFDRDRARFFFGRDNEIAMATQKLGDTPEGHRRWLQVEGASGTGKSSLARAGLLPAIVDKGWIAGAPPAFRVGIFRPGPDPVLSLAQGIYDALKDRLPPEARSLDLVATAFRSSDTALGSFLREHTPKGHGFLLLADQLEEAFSLAGGEPRARFDALLAHAVRDSGGPLYLITTMRSDFVVHFRELPALEAILNADAARYHLKVMSGPELRAAIEGPAKLAGLSWESGLSERILADASASEGGLPLVAHVLRALWAKRDGRSLRHAAYDALGGVGGALTRSADGLINGLGPEGRERARRLLLRLVKIGRGTADMRQMVPRREALAAALAGEEAERVLTRMSGGRDPKKPDGAEAPARLVMVGMHGEEEWVDLVHEALLRRWATLKGWIEASRKALERRDDLEAAAQVWEAAGAPQDDLPGGAQLAYLRGAETFSERGRRYLEAAGALERRRTEEREAGERWLSAEMDEAKRQRAIAEQRLRDALALADEINATIDARLEPIAGAAEVRKALLKQTAALQERLLAGAVASKEALHSRLVTHSRRGDLAMTHDDLAVAQREYEAGLQIAQKLVELDPESALYRTSLSTCYENLGDAARAGGNLAAARDLFNKCLSLCEALVAADPKDTSLRRNLAHSYINLGDVEKVGGDLAKARVFFEKSLSLCEALVAADPKDTSLRRNLAHSYINLGDVEKVGGDLAKARAFFEKSLAPIEPLAAAYPENALLRHDLSTSYLRLGEVAKASGDLAKAHALFTRCFALREALAAADPGNVALRRSLSVGYRQLVAVEKAGGDLAAAALFEKSIEPIRALSEADPENAAIRNDLVASYLQLGDLSQTGGDIAKARALFENALKLIKTLSDADPTNAAHRYHLAVSYDRVGNVAYLSRDIPAARELLDQSLTIMKALSEADPGNASLRHGLSLGYLRRCAVAQAEDDFPSLRAFMDKGLTILEDLAVADPENASIRHDLFVSYRSLGNVAWARGDLATARRLFRKDSELCKALSDVEPHNATLRYNLAISYSRLGNVLQACSDLSAACELFTECVEINKALAEADPSNVQRQLDLVFTHGRLASLAHKTGDSALFRAHHGAATELLDALERKAPTDWSTYLAQMRAWLAGLTSSA